MRRCGVLFALHVTVLFLCFFFGHLQSEEIMDHKIEFRLYMISDRKMCAPKVLPLVVKQAVQVGVKAVQIREKDLPPDALFRLCDDVQNSVAQYGAHVIVNDRADIAAAVGAAGVQLTEESIPVSAARRILGPDALIGISCHSVNGVKAAERNGADFVVFGPVFRTATHPGASPQGCGALELVCSQVSLPVFAVGGVTPDNAEKCLNAGAWGVACLRSVIGADSVRSAVRSFKRVLPDL